MNKINLGSNSRTHKHANLHSHIHTHVTSANKFGKILTNLSIIAIILIITWLGMMLIAPSQFLGINSLAGSGNQDVNQGSRDEYILAKVVSISDPLQDDFGIYYKVGVELAGRNRTDIRVDKGNIDFFTQSDELNLHVGEQVVLLSGSGQTEISNLGRNPELTGNGELTENVEVVSNPEYINDPEFAASPDISGNSETTEITHFLESTSQLSSNENSSDNINFSNDQTYQLVDKFRLPGLILIIFLFLIFGLVVLGRKGARSLLALVLTVITLVGIVIPSILAGNDPIVVVLIAAILLTLVSIFLSHGISKASVAAFSGITINLLLATLLSSIAIELTGFAVAGEEELFIFTGGLGDISAKGILMAGIILGSLAVLDDAAVSQAVLVRELIAEKSYSVSKQTGSIQTVRIKLAEIYTQAMRVGSEHIAALINTLFLAYAGASFTLLILILGSPEQPVWLLLNSPEIVQEAIRGVIGSVVLISTIPLTTLIASYLHLSVNSLPQSLYSVRKG